MQDSRAWHKDRLLDGLRGEEGFPAEVTNALGPTMGVEGGQVSGEKGHSRRRA